MSTETAQNVSNMVVQRLSGTCHFAGNMIEIVKDRLYFTSIDGRPRVDSQTSFFNFDDEAHYESFYTDFGPMNLAVLYHFCVKLQAKLKTTKRKRLIVYTASHSHKRVNGAFLLGSYAIIYLNQSADDVWQKFKDAQPPKFIPFRDAAMGPSTYDLTLAEVFRGVEKAIKFGWLDFESFDANEYEHYERVENGDFNWILPNKILSFCGPHNKSVIENGYPYHSPETYFRYFRERNITTIIRLNKKIYDAKRFVAAGFDHIDLFFVDGSVPSNDIVKKFIDAVDQAKGAVAVHCKAGLGRTGTLIACWMMKEYGLSASECMAWTRICRPGSVIGPQQQFLVDKQRFCWSLGAKHKSPTGALGQLTTKVDHIRLGARQQGAPPRPKALNRLGTDVNANDETQVNSLGHTQGDRLLHLKARHQAGALGVPPVGAKFTSPTTPVKQVQRHRLLEQSALAKSDIDNNNATRHLQFGAEGLPTKMPRVSLKNSASSSGLGSTPSSSATAKLSSSKSASSVSDKKVAHSPRHLRPSPYSIPNLPRPLVKPKCYYLRTRVQPSAQGPVALRRPAQIQRKTSTSGRKSVQ